jgi:hypothetical protein
MKASPTTKPPFSKVKVASTKERADKSPTKQATRVISLEEESVFINQSLTTLGRIFTMLANRKLGTKIKPPYRESKLTRILEDSLT